MVIFNAADNTGQELGVWETKNQVGKSVKSVPKFGFATAKAYWIPDPKPFPDYETYVQTWLVEHMAGLAIAPDGQQTLKLLLLQGFLGSELSQLQHV